MKLLMAAFDELCSPEATDLEAELTPEYLAVSLYTTYRDFLCSKLSEAKRNASPDLRRRLECALWFQEHRLRPLDWPDEVARKRGETT